jgi:NACalpha-BTF3-like transcription factor
MIQVENNLLAITNVIFKERNKWEYITDLQKEEFAFIINRFFAKIYPIHSQLLNHKSQDKVSLLNTWFYFQDGKPYPQKFWSKSKVSKEDEVISNEDIKLLMDKLDINKKEDVVFLKNNWPEIIEEELKWFKRKKNN